MPPANQVDGTHLKANATQQQHHKTDAGQGQEHEPGSPESHKLSGSVRLEALRSDRPKVLITGQDLIDEPASTILMVDYRRLREYCDSTAERPGYGNTPFSVYDYETNVVLDRKRRGELPSYGVGEVGNITL